MIEQPGMFDLNGRVAIVTGAAGLLGSEFCLTLAKAGASVVVADIDYEGSRRITQSLDEQGYQAKSVAVDVTEESAVNRMVETTLTEYKRLDILVNSAALDPKFDPDHEEQHTNAFEDFPRSVWDQALAVNLTGMFLCCQQAVRPMLSQGSGVIINISSMYGIVGPDQRLYQREGEPPRYKPVYYSVSKAGVLGLTRYLATYYAGKNIRVNALTGGGVFNNHDESFLKSFSARAVLGRMARKDELNGALLFLASDASSYMTGANLVVDGGWMAW